MSVIGEMQTFACFDSCCFRATDFSNRVHNCTRFDAGLKTRARGQASLFALLSALPRWGPALAPLSWGIRPGSGGVEQI